MMWIFWNRGYVLSGSDRISYDSLEHSTWSTKAGQYYYEYPSQATGYQLDQTLDGVRYAKNLTNQLLKGITLIDADAETIDARNTINANKQFIAEEVVAYVEFNYAGITSSTSYNRTKCKRDIGYIVDAVSKDVRDYTSKNILEVTKKYFNIGLII